MLGRDREGTPAPGWLQSSGASLVDLLVSEAPEFHESLVLSLELLPIPPPQDLPSAMFGAFGAKVPAAPSKPAAAGAGPAGLKPPPAIAPPIPVEPRNVRALSLSLCDSGFQGSLRFVMLDDKQVGGPSKDPLAPLFALDDLLQVRLALKPKLGAKAPAGAEALVVHGLVAERAMVEVVTERLASDPVLLREYTVRFADPAKLLWTQHFPCELHTMKSLKDLLELHRGEHIRIGYPDKTLVTPEAVLFTGLDHGLPPPLRASFYDFLLWSLDRQHARWLYDYRTQSYAVQGPPVQLGMLLKAKVQAAPLATQVKATPAAGKPAAVASAGPAPGPPPRGSWNTAIKGTDSGVFGDLLSLKAIDTAQVLAKPLPAVPPALADRVVLQPREILRLVQLRPATDRATSQILNSHAAAPQRYFLYNKQAALGMRRDVLGRSLIAAETEQRAVEEAQRTLPAPPELLLHFRAFPSAPIWPGGIVDFKGDPQPWQDAHLPVPLYAQEAPCRIHRLDLCAETLEGSVFEPSGTESARYRCQLAARLEPVASPALRLPAYLPPHFPLYAEGRVVIDPAFAAAMKPPPAGGQSSASSSLKAEAKGAEGEKPVPTEVGKAVEPQQVPGPLYQLFKDPATLAVQYKVELPLWGKQQILASHSPHPLTGAQCVPLLDGERVLVALFDRKAVIEGVLDLRPALEMPQETQGNQILIGKSIGNATTLRQQYVGDQPVFAMSLAHAAGKDWMALAPGALRLSVGKPHTAATVTTTGDQKQASQTKPLGSGG